MGWSSTGSWGWMAVLRTTTETQRLDEFCPLPKCRSQPGERPVFKFYIHICLQASIGLPHWLSNKESACNAGNAGSSLVELKGKGEGGGQEKRRPLNKTLGGFFYHYYRSKALYLDTQAPKLNVKYNPALETWSVSAGGGVLTVHCLLHVGHVIGPLSSGREYITKAPVSAEELEQWGEGHHDVLILLSHLKLNSFDF